MLKVLKVIHILFDPSILLLRMYPKAGKQNINVHKYLAAKMLLMALVIIANKENNRSHLKGLHPGK